MTFEEFGESLKALPRDVAIVFTADGQELAGGYYISELKHARIAAIDCAGRQSKWDEAILQLLDGAGGRHMSAGKLSDIVERSLSEVSGLGSAQLRVEFSPGNRGLGIYGATVPELAGPAAHLRLEPVMGDCKPMRAAARRG